MRQDMQKILGDTRRSGGHCKFAKHRRDGARDVDDLPGRESMTIRHKRDWDHKPKAYRSAPIRRWLEAQVGRPWDKVLSELATIGRETNAGREAWDTVDWKVETDVYMREDGVPMQKKAYHRREYEVSGLYVHPKTAILCRVDPERYNQALRERKAREAAELLARRRAIAPNRLLVKFAEHWYIVELAPIPKAPARTNEPDIAVKRDEDVAFDALLRFDAAASYGWHQMQDSQTLYGKRDVYAKSAKQASHQELKRYGVI
jgi:hypothetical protein